MILRVYLDEDVMPSTAPLLRARGYDVVSSREARADGETDRQQFERARADGRAILTYNYTDFMGISAEEADVQRPHSGIIVSYHQYDGGQTGLLANALQAFIEEHSAEQLANTLLVLPRPKPG